MAAKYLKRTCSTQNKSRWSGANCDLCGRPFVKGQVMVTLNFRGAVGRALAKVGAPECHEVCIRQAGGVSTERRVAREARVNADMEEFRKLVAERVGVS